MQISPLSASESEKAIALWHECGLVQAWNDPASDIRDALASPNATILAARENGVLFGTLMACYDGHRGWVYYLATAPTRRHEGIGRKLVAAGESWLASQGARIIRLMIRADNSRVVSFYGALGYEQSDMIVMGKKLPAHN